MIKEMLRAGYSENEIAEILVENGQAPITARTIIDIELGRSTGDVISLDDRAENHPPIDSIFVVQP